MFTVTTHSVHLTNKVYFKYVIERKNSEKKLVISEAMLRNIKQAPKVVDDFDGCLRPNDHPLKIKSFLEDKLVDYFGLKMTEENLQHMKNAYATLMRNRIK